MTDIEALRKAVDLAGSQSELARRLGGKIKQQHVNYWLANGYVPADQVIPIARAVGFQVTPHQIDQAIYPNETDGLPAAEERVA